MENSPEELTNIKQNRLKIVFENGDTLSEDDIDSILSFASTS